MPERNTRMDYRGYHVEPPRSRSNPTDLWRGVATLEGMPDLTAPSETDLRKDIDHAHSLPGPKPWLSKYF